MELSIIVPSLILMPFLDLSCDSSFGVHNREVGIAYVSNIGEGPVIAVFNNIGLRGALEECITQPDYFKSRLR